VFPGSGARPALPGRAKHERVLITFNLNWLQARNPVTGRAKLQLSPSQNHSDSATMQHTAPAEFARQHGDGVSADLTVSELSDTSVSCVEWDHYVRLHACGSPFHVTAWQRQIQKTFGHEPHHLVARAGAEGPIVGILPLFLVRSWIFGRMLISTPQAAYGGALADSEAAYDGLLARARVIADRNRVRFVELRNFRNELASETLLTKDLYVTFRQELSPDPQRNMAAIPRKTRAEIREGIRNGLEFRADEIGVDGFFAIYSRNVRDLGTPVFSKRLFANGMREFGHDSRIFSVHWKGRPVAAVWTLFYKDEVFPYYGGSIRSFNHLAVNNFMYWMLIKYGCENGYRVFDFGRSKKGTGSWSFKKRWGMTVTDLPYQYQLVRQTSLPDTSPLNPRFTLSIQLWRHLPLAVTNRLGPVIARHLV
jgi:FemAB-related protein (PEP-CTERM system-associated)